MEPKKISFGFSKLTKKTIIVSNHLKQDDKKIELIECLEGQSIKVKDAVEEVKEPLVIPIKDNQKNLLDRIREVKKREKKLHEQKETEEVDSRPDSELSVDELAARQLIREAKDRLDGKNTTTENRISVLPLRNENVSLDGEKEPTLEDYESIPISDYGLALLRGMGWKEGMTVGKNTSKKVSVSVPELRPKGLGLGATKVVQSEIPAKKPVDNDGKELNLVKGAYAKVIAGVQKGNYCEVQGFDEDAGRVIVKVYPQGDILNINEFMLLPVTKEEFSKGSRILNNAKYMEVISKKMEKNKTMQELSKSSLDSEGHFKTDIKTKGYNKDVSSSSSDESGSHMKQRDDDIRDKPKSKSFDDEKEKRSQKHSKSKYRDRSRSRSASKHRSENRRNRRRSRSSSEAEYYEKEKNDKHTKSKYQDRRDKSRSRDKFKKSSKHKSKQREHSSSSESDYKKDKRKKNKCKSRHRRNSSSSSTDRKSYRSKR